MFKEMVLASFQCLFLVEGISTEKNDTVACRAELQGLSELVHGEGFEKYLAPVSKQALKNM